MPTAFDTPSSDALHRLGQLLAAKGDFATAKRLFRILTTVRPDAAKRRGSVWARSAKVSVSTRKHCASTSNSCGCSRICRMAEVNAALLAAIEPARPVGPEVAAHAGPADRQRTLGLGEGQDLSELSRWKA